MMFTEEHIFISGVVIISLFVYATVSEMKKKEKKEQKN